MEVQLKQAEHTPKYWLIWWEGFRIAQKSKEEQKQGSPGLASTPAAHLLSLSSSDSLFHTVKNSYLETPTRYLPSLTSKQDLCEEFGALLYWGDDLKKYHEGEWGSETKEESLHMDVWNEQPQLREPNPTRQSQKECGEPSDCPPEARRRGMCLPAPFIVWELLWGWELSSKLACSPSQRMALCRQTQISKLWQESQWQTQESQIWVDRYACKSHSPSSASYPWGRGIALLLQLQIQQAWRNSWSSWLRSHDHDEPILVQQRVCPRRWGAQLLEWEMFPGPFLHPLSVTKSHSLPKGQVLRRKSLTGTKLSGSPVFTNLISCRKKIVIIKSQLSFCLFRKIPIKDKKQF